MGIDGLYTIGACEERDGGHVFNVALDSSHTVFAGHFPQMPVLPGVCAMHIAKACASQVVGKSLKYVAVTEVKFVSAVLPAECPQVEVELGMEQSPEGYALRAQLLSGGGVMVKLRALLV